jgi:hypothetical protein
MKSLQANAVLLANQVNVSIFQQVWLIEHGIVLKEEFTKDFFFTPVAVSVPTQRFDFLVAPDRVQIGIKDVEGAVAILGRTLGTITAKLPHTPYTALGFNFNYSFDSTSPLVSARFLRNFVLRADNPLAPEFATEDARFGMFASKNFREFRLSLDIKPVASEQGESLAVNLNFHRSLTALVNTAEIVQQSVGLWRECFSYSEDLLQQITPRTE